MRSLVVCVARPSGYERSVRLAGRLAGDRYLRVSRPPAQVQVRATSGASVAREAR